MTSKLLTAGITLVSLLSAYSANAQLFKKDAETSPDEIVEPIKKSWDIVDIESSKGFSEDYVDSKGLTFTLDPAKDMQKDSTLAYIAQRGDHKRGSPERIISFDRQFEDNNYTVFFVQYGGSSRFTQPLGEFVEQTSPVEKTGNLLNSFRLIDNNYDITSTIIDSLFVGSKESSLAFEEFADKYSGNQEFEVREFQDIAQDTAGLSEFISTYRSARGLGGVNTVSVSQNEHTVSVSADVDMYDLVVVPTTTVLSKGAPSALKKIAFNEVTYEMQDQLDEKTTSLRSANDSIKELVFSYDSLTNRVDSLENLKLPSAYNDTISYLRNINSELQQENDSLYQQNDHLDKGMQYYELTYTSPDSTISHPQAMDSINTLNTIIDSYRSDSTPVVDSVGFQTDTTYTSDTISSKPISQDSTSLPVQNKSSDLEQKSSSDSTKQDGFNQDSYW
ncbi:MAG: hypothetical protein ACQESC_00030 [Nanobdellota archaeon]